MLYRTLGTIKRWQLAQKGLPLSHPHETGDSQRPENEMLQSITMSMSDHQSKTTGFSNVSVLCDVYVEYKQGTEMLTGEMARSAGSLSGRIPPP